MAKTREELLEEIEELQARLQEAEGVAKILEQSSQPFAVGNSDGRLIRVNRAYCELTGYSEKELLSDVTWNETLTPPDWREREATFIQEVLSTQRSGHFEKEYIRKTGERIPVELFVQLSPDLPDQLYGFVTDISERKKLDAERAESEARYRDLIDHLSSGVVHVSVAGEITLANEEAQRVLGLSYDAMSARYVNDWEGETLREDGSICPVAEYPVSRCLMTGKAQAASVVGVRRPDGATSWAIFTARPQFENGELSGAVVAFRDITDWRQAEESVILLSATIEQSPVSVMMTDHDGQVIYVNPAFTNSTGYTSQDILGKNPRVLQSGVHPPEFYEELWSTVKAGEIWRADICNRRKNGELYWELTSIGPVRSLDGEIRHFVAIKVDDTERRAAETALTDSEELFRAVTQTANDPIIALDGEGGITVWNPAASRVFGYSAAEVLGRPLAELRVLPDDIFASIEASNEASTGVTVETRARRKDGSDFAAEISVAQVRYGDSWNRTAIVRDTTERKRLERELLRISKLESVGVLAGGIAHDFNNILTGILANVSLASRNVDKASLTHELLDAASGAALRATGLTRQLLTFSKGGAPVKSIISISNLGESATFVLRGSNVRCDTQVADDLWPVEADSGQLDQVIQNLIINADHAMPAGGVIRVSARNRVLAAGEMPPLKPADYVEITVADEGAGIPAEHIDRVFDPYFTTKQKGSGLGLATAFSVITNHHGHITVSSKRGMGATFRIFLPAKRSANIDAPQQPKVAPSPREGRILVMDDDLAIRKVAQRILRDQGYEVDLAEDGEMALLRYQTAAKEGRPYELAIVDLTVPGGMGGLPTLAGLKKLNPKLCVIVTSGYSDDPVMASPKEFGFCSVIAKPFSPESLADAVDACLGQA